MKRGFIKLEDQEPDIEGFQFYLDAFFELGTTRQFGMGIGPIPFTAIAEYFRIYSIAGDFDEFAGIIRHMDNVYLELEAADVKKTQQNKGSKASGNTNSDKKNSNQS